jgi:hypothetical protein
METVHFPETSVDFYRTTRVISHETVPLEPKIDSLPFTCNITNTPLNNFYLRKPQSLKYLTREMLFAFIKAGTAFSALWLALCKA